MDDSEEDNKSRTHWKNRAGKQGSAQQKDSIKKGRKRMQKADVAIRVNRGRRFATDEFEQKIKDHNDVLGNVETWKAHSPSQNRF